MSSAQRFLLCTLATSALAFTASCSRIDDLDIESESYAGMSANGMSANGMSANGMSANGMSANGMSANGMSANGLQSRYMLALNPVFNRETLDHLTSHPLRSDTLATSSVLHTPLNAPEAREFMYYLVKCALQPSQVVRWTNPKDDMKYAWKGALGFASQWGSNASTIRDQERVSACLLAHNNPFGVHVPISLRGLDLGLDGAQKTSTTTIDGARIPSFHRCSLATVSSTRGSEVQRTCGWEPAHIGQCEPGERVVVGAGAADPFSSETCAGSPVGSSQGDWMLRVCAGTKGCDSCVTPLFGLSKENWTTCEGTKSNYIAQADDSCGTKAPSVSFACPEDGYFSVMLAPHTPRSLFDISAIRPVALPSNSSSQNPATPNRPTIVAMNANYPAHEADVYDFHEGAFYGNIFDSGSLAVETFWGYPNDRLGFSSCARRSNSAGGFSGGSSSTPDNPTPSAPDPNIHLDLSRDNTWVSVQGGCPVERESISLPIDGRGNGIFIFKNMWACHGPTWSDPTTQMMKRVCAGSKDLGRPRNANCLARPTGLCDAPVGTAHQCDVSWETQWGRWGTPESLERRDHCKDRNLTSWYEPLTVYLNTAEATYMYSVEESYPHER